jgi:DnaJ-class molecular chaperone
MPREQYEVSWKDYYEILQVHPKAEPEVILAAYRKLAQVYHPDRNKSESATQRFQEINEAKEVLSDPERRARYD